MSPAEPAVFGRAEVAAPTAAEAAAADRAAHESVPERVLMENAGRAAALVLDRLFPVGRVVAVVGGGNNGGDGLVLLRALASWGREVAWIPAASGEPDAALAHGFDLHRLDPADAALALAGAGVVVDAILGTGARGAPRAPAATLIRRINESGRPVVALDLPSGVDSTTGAVPGEAVRAAVTVSFGWPKQELLFQPARSRCGRLIAVEIGFPRAVTPTSAALITPDWARRHLPRRAPDAHKNTEGRVLVLAGSTAMGGAALLCAEAAARAGAGLVRVATDAALRGVLQASLPEAIAGDRTDEHTLREFASRSTALLAGPGLGLDAVAEAALERALALTPGLPTLLDADALTLFADRLDELGALAGARPLVLTPHPGEMSRLTGEAARDVAEAPIRSARELAERLGCVVLLKGAPSVVAAPDAPVLIDTAGSSDAATAGMGDHLAGVIAALLALGTLPRTAAALGLCLSARAVELAGRGRSLSPRDASARLAEAYADPGARASGLGLPFVTLDQPPRH